MPCYKIVEWVCQRNHRSSLPCSQVKGSCRLCDKEDREQERKRQRDLILETKRAQRQAEYARNLAEINDEMDNLRRLEKDRLDGEERARVLQQHREDLARLKHAKANRMVPVGVSRTAAGEGQTRDNASDARNKRTYGESKSLDEWTYQKQYLGAQSPEIDTLMDMVGLEAVKDKFLSIKSRVDTAVRQGIPATGERFGSVLLGNPGTGNFKLD
jgi:DNA repair exonuclease SbcCD ATPase subunit